MNIREAFDAFAANLTTGQEGVFFADTRNVDQPRWWCGWGVPTQGSLDEPFAHPRFFAFDYEGAQHLCVSFPSTASYTDFDALVPLRGERPSLAPWRPEESLEEALCIGREEFLSRVRQVQHKEKDGEAWVVVLGHLLRGALPEKTALLGAYRDFLATSPYHIGGVWWTAGQQWVSFSPEVFIEQRGSTIMTCPIKGTGTREYLQQSEKERAELCMITDLLRNDVGRIATNVRVTKERFFTDVGQYAHAQSEIVADIPGGMTEQDFRDMLPAGSVTGAPKHWVMSIIRELEKEPRGWYTGTFGVKFSEGDLLCNLLIRTLFADGDRWRFGTAAGITVDSEPQQEWEETLKKARFLFAPEKSKER